MKAILIVFEENVEAKIPIFTIETPLAETRMMQMIERVLREYTRTNKDIELTTMSEIEYHRFLGKPKNVNTRLVKEPLPIFVETIRFLDELKDMYHGTDLGFIIHAVVTDKKKRPCIAAGIDLCKRFTKLINIGRNKKAFSVYMNHLDDEELDNLIHFIKIISKI